MLDITNRGVKKRLKDVAEDLCNLEINTIIKPSITGNKMPPPRLALVEIYDKFNNRVDGIELKENSKPGDYSSFLSVKTCIPVLLENLENQEEEEEKEAEMILLKRIRRMTDEILSIFERLKESGNGIIKGQVNWQNTYKNKKELEKKDAALKLTTKELIMIRKIWEVGVEEIAMQTVIQLDGDVLTRITPKYADKKYEALHQLHNQSVSKSISFWQELVKLVTSVLSDFVKKFF